MVAAVFAGAVAMATYVSDWMDLRDAIPEGDPFSRRARDVASKVTSSGQAVAVSMYVQYVCTVCSFVYVCMYVCLHVCMYVCFSLVFALFALHNHFATFRKFLGYVNL